MTSSSPDLIVVLREGKVIEQGTHEELMRLGGLYHSMWVEQASDAFFDSEKDSDLPESAIEGEVPVKAEEISGVAAAPKAT